MSESSANLLYSMLFGDRSSLDDEMQENLRLTGLGHILAVSGLHVGLVVGLLAIVLKLCRANKYIKISIIGAVLIFYLYLCDFRVSMIRASIMFFTLLGMGLFARKTDLITRVCFAWGIILMLFPHQLLSMSFQMSFACLFGIALFYQPISKFLQRIIPGKLNWKMGENDGTSQQLISTSNEKHSRGRIIWERVRIWLIGSFTMCLTTALVTFPLLLYMFGFVSLVSIFANLLLLPLIILAFKLTVLALITYGVPFLYIADILMRAVIWSSEQLARLPVLRMETEGLWHIAYFVALIILSRFIFLRTRYRYAAAALCFAFYGVALLIMNT